MKKEKSSLDRLLLAAAQAPRAALPAPSFPLEARVLAQWRRALAAPETNEFLVTWFRRAALAACALACASLLLSHPAKSNNGGLMAVADSAMGMGVE